MYVLIVLRLTVVHILAVLAFGIMLSGPMGFTTMAIINAGVTIQEPFIHLETLEAMQQNRAFPEVDLAIADLVFLHNSMELF